MAEYALTLRSTLSYAGQKVCALSDDTVVFVSGNALLFIAVDKDCAQSYLPNTAGLGGISALASSYSHRALAFAPRGPSPDVLVYKNPSSGSPLHVATLAGCTALEVAEIAFARDGSRALAVGRSPDFNLAVWENFWAPDERGSAERHQPVASTALPFECEWTSFNPAHPNQMCAGGRSGVAILELEVHHHKVQLLWTHWVAGTDAEGNATDGGLLSLTCHQWSPDGRQLWCGNSRGQLVLYNTPVDSILGGTAGPPPALVLDVPGCGAANGGICSLLLTLDRLGVGGGDGRLRWLGVDALLVGEVEIESILDGAAGEGGGAAPLTCLVATPSFESVCVGSSGGSLAMVALPAPEGDAAGPEGDEGGGGLAAAADERPPQQLVMGHGNLVTGTCAVRVAGNERAMLATASLDGSVMVKHVDDADAAAGAPLARRAFAKATNAAAAEGEEQPQEPDPCTCMANRGTEALLAVGSLSGALRLLVVQAKHKTVELLLAHTTRLFTKACSHVVFHPTRPLLAVASAEQGAVMVVDLRPEGSLDAICHGSLPAGGGLVLGVEWAGAGGGSLLVSAGDGVQAANAALYELAVDVNANVGAAPQRMALARAARLETAGRSPFAAGCLLHGSSLLVGEGDSAPATLLATTGVSRWLSAFDASSMVGVGGAAKAGAADDDNTSAAALAALEPQAPTAEFGRAEGEAEDESAASKDGGAGAVSGGAVSGHAAPITAVAVLPGASLAATGQQALVATGGCDGRIVVWSVHRSAGAGGVELQLVASAASAHRQAVLSLAFVPDAKGVVRLVSSGLFGTVGAWQLATPDGFAIVGGADAKIPVSAFASRSFQLAPGAGVHGAPGELTYLEARAARVAAEAEVSDRRAREASFTRVEELRLRLKALTERNNAAPELERMTAEEFVIDLEGVAKKEAEQAAAADELRLELQRKNDATNVVTDRVRKTCWDSNLVPAKELYSMADGEPDKEHADGLGDGEGGPTAALVVTNMPLPAVSAAQVAQLGHVTRQRQLELLEMKAAGGNGDPRRVWGEQLKAVPHNAKWMAGGMTMRAVGADGEAAEEEDGADGGSELSAAAATLELNAEGVPVSAEGLLYHPCALRTAVQRRRQIVLLHAVIAELKGRFNDAFEQRLEEKQAAMDKYSAASDRVLELLLELGREPDHHIPRWRALEAPEDVLKTPAAELSTVPYVTAAMREQLATEEAEKKAREAAAKKDNVGERALMDMMNGTLETKNPADALKEKMSRVPEWMVEGSDEYVAPEAYDDEQKAAAAAFEELQAQLAAQKEKERKAAELDLKKLLAEMGEVERGFDEALARLAAQRTEVQTAVAQRELTVLQLQLSVSSTAADRGVCVAAERTLAELSGARGELAEHAADCRAALDTRKAAVATAAARDRELERGFKPALSKPPFSVQDQALIKALLEMFRLRKAEVASNAAGGNGGTGSGTGSLAMTKAEANATAAAAAAGLESSGRPDGGRGSVSRRPARRPSQSSGASGSRRVSVGRNSVSKFANSVYKKGGGSGKESSASGSMAQELAQAASGAAVRKATSARDPYLRADRLAEARVAAETPTMNMSRLDPERDVPPEAPLDHDLFLHVDELRLAKMAQEVELAKLTAAQRKAVALLAKAEHALAYLDGKISTTVQASRDAVARSDRATKSLPLLVTTKQGQQELDMGPLGTEVADGMLIDAAVVHQSNALISKHGDEKVAIMTRIQNFRKSINYMQWKHRYQAFQAYGLEEHYTDLQVRSMPAAAADPAAVTVTPPPHLTTPLTRPLPFLSSPSLPTDLTRSSPR